MKLKNTHHPIVKLPSEIQISLFLIREELKARKLFHILHELGVSECDYLPNLDSLILQTIGLSTERDEAFSIYTDIMEKRCQKLEGNREALMKQSLKAYHELVNAKKQLSMKE